jgi:hypothetical protein
MGVAKLRALDPDLGKGADIGAPLGEESKHIERTHQEQPDAEQQGDLQPIGLRQIHEGFSVATLVALGSDAEAGHLFALSFRVVILIASLSGVLMPVVLLYPIWKRAASQK